MGFKKNLTENIDDPMQLPESWQFLKKGRVRLIIMFEDASFQEYYRKLKEDYTFTVKKRKYLIVPDCVIIGKFPTFFYYFNNPMPVKFSYQRSKMNTEKMTDPKVVKALPFEKRRILAETVIDGSALNVAFNSNLINKMYAESRLTVKNLLIILVVVTVITLLILHFTGVINLFELLSGASPSGE